MKNITVKQISIFLITVILSYLVLLQYTSRSTWTPFRPASPSPISLSHAYVNSGNGPSLHQSSEPGHAHATRNASSNVNLRVRNGIGRAAGEKPLAEYTESDRLKQHRGSPCHNLSFAHPPLPVTALLSFPRSGNTWFRHLLQEATGLVTGAIYGEAHVLRDFPGGGIRDGRVVVVKSHDIKVRIKNISRAIILIRNPYRTQISYYKWLRRHKPMSKEGWEKHVADQSKQWFETYKNWLKLQMPKLVVVYKDLRRNLKGELKRAIQFLNITVTDNELNCMMQNSEGTAHQKPTNMSLYTLSENSTKIFQSHVSAINGFLLQNHLDRTVDEDETDRRSKSV